MKKPSYRKIKIMSEVEAKEMFEGEVKAFGGGSAYIPFTKDYLNHKVIIIPLAEKSKS